jgi:HK97 family phage portal protein
MAFFNNKNGNDSPGMIQKMNSVIQNAIQSLFKVRWSMLPRRATSAHLELFHTSPRLDALDMIASDAAHAIFRVYHKKDLRTGLLEDANPVYDHPVYDILENPIPSHPEWDGWMLRYLTVVYIELNGECFWVLVRDASGRPREIYPIPSLWCIQTPTEAQPFFLIVPLNNVAGRTMQIDPRDVIWFKNPDAVSPYGRGRGRTEAVDDEIETDEYAAKWAKNFYYNNASPESVMTMPGANTDQIKQFKESWMQQHSGVQNAHKMGMVGWDAKLLQLQTSPKELDFNKSRLMLRDMINAHWAIPPEMMGIIENSNRATIDSSFYLYAKNVLLRRLTRMESVINRQLMPMYGSEWMIKFDNVVPEDKEFALTVSNAGFASGALTVDEWRVANGKPPIGGLQGDQRFVAMALTPIQTLLQAPKPELTEDDQEAGNVTPEDNSPDQTRPAYVTNNPPLIETPPVVVPIPIDSQTDGKSAKKKGFSIERKSEIWHQFDKAATAQEYPFRKAMKKVADYQQKEFNREFEDLVGTGLSPSEAIGMATTHVFGEEANNSLMKSLYSGWMDSMKAGMSLANEIAGIKIDFTLVQPAFREWIDKHGLEKATSINDTTKAQLSKSLGDGIDAGESIRELQSRIADQFDGLRDYRTERIARTETAGSMNYGSIETYKSGGISQKSWLTTMDSRTRDDHAMLDGETIAIDDDFDVGGDSMSAPGLGSDPAENCNCRCSILPVVGEKE